MVKNIGPAIAGGTITHTHKDSEKLADLRIKSTRLNEKQVRNDLDLDDSILLGSNGSKHSDTNSGQDSPDLDSHLYDDILSQNGVINDDFLDQKDPDTFNLVIEIFLNKTLQTGPLLFSLLLLRITGLILRYLSKKWLYIKMSKIDRRAIFYVHLMMVK